MARDGIEPPTHRASIYCYYHLSYRAYIKMIPLTPQVSYVGEPFNQQVFEPQPSTVRLNYSCFLLSRNCTSKVKGFNDSPTLFRLKSL